MFKGMQPDEKRQANINLLERMVISGVEVNGSGSSKFDGAEEDYLVLSYMYLTGLTEKKAREHLEMLVRLRRLVRVKDKEKSRIFDPFTTSALYEILVHGDDDIV